MQPFIQALPLTALIDALRGDRQRRAIARRVASEMAILTAWGAISFVVALKLFRWQ